MKKLLNNILVFLGIRDAEGATPLTKDKAYVIYASRGRLRDANLDRLFNDSVKEILRSISNLATYRELYKLIEYPKWYHAEQKDALMDKLKELGFILEFHNDDVILISWK